MKLSEAVARRGRRLAHAARKASGTVARRTPPRSRARIGVFVAFYDAAEIFPVHLAAFHKNTVGPYNYYVMKNCTTLEQQVQFDRIISRFRFPVCFEPWPALVPFSHAESLQRMIDATTEEIIVLCDVDAFPVRRGWDEIVLAELETKEAMGVVCYMPGRTEFEIVLHPSFLAFRREYLVSHGLDVCVEGDNDPAFKITKHLVERGRFSVDHVAPLLPTRHELELFPDRRHGDVLGSRNLSHGFGTVYGGMVFHLWFWSWVRNRVPVRDSAGKVIVTPAQMEDVMCRLRAGNMDFGGTAVSCSAQSLAGAAAR